MKRTKSSRGNTEESQLDANPLSCQPSTNVRGRRDFGTSDLKTRVKDGAKMSLLQHEEQKSQRDEYLKLVQDACQKVSGVPSTSAPMRVEKPACPAKKRKATGASSRRTIPLPSREEPHDTSTTPTTSKQNSYAKLLDGMAKRLKSQKQR